MRSFFDSFVLRRIASVRNLGAAALCAAALLASVVSADPPESTTVEKASEPADGADSAAPSGVPATDKSARSAPVEVFIPGKVTRYAQYVLAEHDRNRDGVLQGDEWKTLQGQPESIDLNQDGSITLNELARWIADYGVRRRIGVISPITTNGAAAGTPGSPDEENGASQSVAASGGEGTKGDRRRNLKFYVPAGRLPDGLPDWFLARDEDGDGQLTIGEFSPKAIPAELAEFGNYDANGDGILTSRECSGRSSEKKADAAQEEVKESNRDLNTPNPTRRKAARTGGKPGNPR